MIEVDALIIGGGASGLTSSMLLARQGISTYLVSRYAQTSRLPKAHVLSTKTMEIYRELGLDSQIRALATPLENWGYVGYYAGVAGPHEDYGREILRLGSLVRGGADADWLSASASAPANLPQSMLEPLLKEHAESLSPGSVQFNHSIVSLTQDDEWVTATIEDRASGEHYEVRARYLLGCDGGRTVGPQIGVELEGDLAVATNISFHFTADLSPWVRGEDILVRSILNPDVGIPRALVQVGPKTWGTKSEEWILHMMAFPGQHVEYDDASAIAEMRRVLGLPDLQATIHVINRWPLDAVVASHFQVGRVFVLGDAAHRMPPAGGHGLNTAVGDCYNLCWKIAAVIKGKANAALLETYESERRPVAQRTVASAYQNWLNTRRLAMAIGFSPTNTPAENWRAIRLIWGEGPESELARRRVRDSLAVIMGTYNPINLSFGYTYENGALIDDGHPAPKSLHDVLVYEPSTHPGHPVPHAWVEDLKGATAIGDLVADGKFTLIAGEDGEAWCAAARAVAARRGLALDAITIGPSSGDWADLRYDWARKREFGPGGAILVRPDRFVAWRSMGPGADPVAQLDDALDQILGTTTRTVPAARDLAAAGAA